LVRPKKSNMSIWKKVVDFWTGTERKTVRARDEEGQFVADDKSTPDVNEAYEEVRVKKTKKGKKKKK
jgi:hypothetical protein